MVNGQKSLTPKSRERKIVESFSVPFFWQGKRADEMTDEDCKDCLQFLAKMTGTHYIWMGD